MRSRTPDPAVAGPWRRSLERSRRRRAALRRRRTRLRGRNSAIFAALALCMLAGGAIASTGGTEAGSSSDSASARTLKPGSRGPAVATLQRKLRVSPVTGYYGSKTKRAVRRFQIRRGLTADGIAGPATLRALGIRVRSGSSSGSDVRLPAVLRRIAQCESGGNPRAVSADGRYRGKYQFTRATWRSVGGTGDPAAAPEAEQDRRALRLYRREGTRPWPNCA